MNQTLKRCTICKEFKPATAEYFHEEKRRNPPALRSACKPCANAQAKRTRNPEKKREYDKQWSKANQERRRKSCRDWRARNLEEQRERERLVKKQDPNRSAKARQWEAENPERKRQSRQEYAKKNKGKLLSILHRYVARKASLPSDFTEDDWQFALNYFGGRCAVCGRPPGLFHTLAMDHWLPISSPNCPGTVPHNIVPLCHGREGCNNSKHDKHPDEWLRQKYGAKKARAITSKIHAYFSRVR